MKGNVAYSIADGLVETGARLPIDPVMWLSRVPVFNPTDRITMAEEGVYLGERVDGNRAAEDGLEGWSDHSSVRQPG